jgi:hypothetical protein
MASDSKMGRKVKRWISTLVLLVIFYLLSVGPAAWISLKASGLDCCQRVLSTAYRPLLKLRDWAGYDFLDPYLRVFIAKEDADALQRTLK